MENFTEIQQPWPGCRKVHTAISMLVLLSWMCRIIGLFLEEGWLVVGFLCFLGWGKCTLGNFATAQFKLLLSCDGNLRCVNTKKPMGKKLQ